MSKKKFMILYGFMVRYGENNRWGPGRPPPPVVFRQNEMPWLLGLKNFQNEIRHRRKTHGQRKASGSLEKRLMASFKIDIPGISQFLHHLAGRQMDMFLRKTILSGQMMRPRALRDT